MERPPRLLNPCVSCGKIYVGKDQMGEIMCDGGGVSCRSGHMWCKDCWMKNYSFSWKCFCPLEKKKEEYKERRFDFLKKNEFFYG